MAKKSENQQVTKSKDKILERARKRFPERKFQSSDVQNAQNAQDGIDDLDDAIFEMLEEYSTKQATYDEENNKLRELLISDPSSAEFLAKWIETGDPRSAIVEIFGDDLGVNEEGQARFKGQLESWRARRAENEKLEKEAQENWNQSLADLDAWGDAKGLSLEKKRDVMLKLLDITFNGMVNKYTTDGFELALAGLNHDTDVERARTEGEVRGRNAKISTARRERNAANAMPPSMPGGQGNYVKEREPQRKKSVWSGLE